MQVRPNQAVAEDIARNPDYRVDLPLVLYFDESVSMLSPRSP
jgi:hypothetical protein